MCPVANVKQAPETIIFDTEQTDVSIAFGGRQSVCIGDDRAIDI
jgi:hypothetical protein